MPIGNIFPCRTAIMARRGMLQCLVAATTCAFSPAVLADYPLTTKAVSATQVSELVLDYFAQRHEFQPKDLISRADGQEVINGLSRLGWKVSDADEILSSMLPPDHIMVKTFATRKGTAFMRKVDGYELIYDRMHRTAELPGGKALVRDIVKLPNGEIYAKQKPVPGNPTLTELLPKRRNGRTPPATDFDKPTGYIYTAADLGKRLEESRRRDFAIKRAGNR